MNTEASHTYIIAEVGVNHNGDLSLAKQSIDAAKAAGADAVKFQTFKAEKLTTKSAKMANYQKTNTGKTESQFDMLKRLELSKEEFKEIRLYCEEKEIDFLSTPFDEESALFLKEIGVQAFKIGSGDLTNIPLLREIDLCGLPVFLSTGMANLQEVKEASECFIYSPVTILHCTSNYPAASSDINLYAMVTLEQELGLPIGYSDHSLGYEVGICAVSLGAKVLEKHFTLDKNLPGPDHKASLDPEEFSDFVNHIRDAEIFLGNGVKRCMPSEQSTKDVARKSVVSTRALSAGEVLSIEDLAIKRPGNGIQPKRIYELIGKKVTQPIPEDYPFQEDDIEWNEK